MIRSTLTAFATRTSGALLAALATLPIVSWTAEGISDGDFFDLFYYADRIALAVFCIVVALIAWFLQGLLVRILVPIPKGARCPRCNHNIEGMTEAVCTECGLELTPEFTATTASLARRGPVAHGAASRHGHGGRTAGRGCGLLRA